MLPKLSSPAPQFLFSRKANALTLSCTNRHQPRGMVLGARRDAQDDPARTLCKATTVAWEGRSCHRHLEGIYLNLLRLLQRKSGVYKAPCPVAGGSATSLSDFLLDLRRALQQRVKGQSLK
uniref:Uncharacterized protein n=1 Tax=Melopsittacus undulatus TaxID=13146 RepID=A0A8V5GDL3_MELUD